MSSTISKESNADLLITVANVKKQQRNSYKCDTKSVAKGQGKGIYMLGAIISAHYIWNIIIHFKVFESNIPFRISIIKDRVHVTLHLMKQVQIIHQLMKYIASTTLHKHSAVGVSMGIDSTSGSLAANIASEGNAHTPTWRLGE